MPVTEPLLPASIYADRLERLRAADGGAGLRPHRRVGRSGAQRQHRLPHRVRPTVRRGGADRRAKQMIRRSCSATSATAWARSAPLPMRTTPVPGPQPARPVAGPIAALARDPGRRGHRARRPDRGRRLEDVREPGDDRGSGLPRRRAEASHRSRRPGGERDRPAHRPSRRAPGHQRGRAAGGVRVGRLPDVVRRAQGADRPAARDDRTGMRATAEVERLAAVVPPHAHRRVEGEIRAAEPRRPAARAGRPVHDRVRDLGSTQLPRRVPRRGSVGAARRNRGLRRTPRRAVLRGGGRLVRGAARRPGRRRAPGHRRPPPGRRVLRGLPQPRAPAPPRRVGELAGVPGLEDRAAIGDGAPVRHHPGDRHALLHDEHRGRRGVGRRVAARRVLGRVPGCLGTRSRPAGTS